ncbi:GNAT family N-acetyltransferase [Pseudoxanthomonas sp. UTMC 1351]|uniref:GNAT family N-acetyltransferase n=1 Tax=Pseudoxanthomonas sp. UTMC 1351 TaxID=2695853 RepID=UPI0034CE4DCE
MANLRRLAASKPVELDGWQVPEGALPPAKTVARALAQLDRGTPVLWCVPFLIVSPSRSTVLGACGFKTAPVNGSVEISYGIARTERGRGAANMALGQLLQRAASSGLVHDVVTHILPGNVASAKLVQRLGFSSEGLLIDADGERVMRWVWRVAVHHP